MERERSEPTNEVGDEGGSPGDIELEQRPVVITGSEATTTFDAITQTVEHVRGGAPRVWQKPLPQ